MKTCLKCLKKLDESDFYRWNLKFPSLRPYCKKCFCLYNKKYQWDHRKIDNIYRFGGKREEVIKRDGEKCVSCGMSREEHLKEFSRDITVDHIDGLGRYSKNKNNSLDNLQTLCLRCHGKKDANRKNNLELYI